MRLLFDTHVFLWAVTANRRLKSSARELLSRADAVYVSAASIWEIAVKARLGKIEADAAYLVDAIDGSGFLNLPVSARHAAAVAKLPPHHSDPFDRMVIAQAIANDIPVLTRDAEFYKYAITAIWQ